MSRLDWRVPVLALLVAVPALASAQLIPGRLGGVFTIPWQAPNTPTDGTAPQYTFQGDTDTGYGYGGTDTLKLSTGGVTRMRIGATSVIADDASTTPNSSRLVWIRRTSTGSGTALALQGVGAGRTQLEFYDDSGALGSAIQSFPSDTYWLTSTLSISTSGGATRMLKVDINGFGYGASMGGTVTQTTSKSTGVTLNKPTGNITMHDASLAGDTAVSFTLTNSTIAATDMVLVQHVSGGTLGAYSAIGAAAAGSATITVRNLTAGALAEAIVLKFVVIKAVTS